MTARVGSAGQPRRRSFRSAADCHRLFLNRGFAIVAAISAMYDPDIDAGQHERRRHVHERRRVLCRKASTIRRDAGEGEHGLHDPHSRNEVGEHPAPATVIKGPTTFGSNVAQRSFGAGMPLSTAISTNGLASREGAPPQ